MDVRIVADPLDGDERPGLDDREADGHEPRAQDDLKETQAERERSEREQED